MKTYFRLIAAAIAALIATTAVAAKTQAFSVVEGYKAHELDDMSIAFAYGDTTLVMMDYSDGGQYESRLIYMASYDTPGQVKLTGIGEIKDNNRGHSYLTKNIPEEIIIEGAYTENPRMRGKFNVALQRDANRAINYEQWEAGKAIYDYYKYPDEYDPDSVARLAEDSYALIESYKKVAGGRGFALYKQKKAEEQRNRARNNRVWYLLLIPLVAGIVLGPMTSSGKIKTNFSKKIRAIAITEIVGGAVMLSLISHAEGDWWVIILGVLAIIVIQIYNLFFGMFTYGYVREELKAKVAWVPLIAFGFSSLLIVYGVVGVIGLILAIFGVSDKLSIGESLGIIAGVGGLVGAAAYWYRTAQLKHAPELKGNFRWVAIVTMFSFVGLLAGGFIALIYVISKGLGPMLMGSLSGGNTGVRSTTDKDGISSCMRCRRRGSECPYSREGNITEVCSYYIPEP